MEFSGVAVLNMCGYLLMTLLDKSPERRYRLLCRMEARMHSHCVDGLLL